MRGVPVGPNADVDDEGGGQVHDLLHLLFHHGFKAVDFTLR
jgi:hypothetical protein